MIKRFAMFVALLASCGGVAKATVKDFDPKTIASVCLPCYPPYLKPGNGVIWGHLKVKTKTFGEVVYPNTDILLMPNNDFSAWYIKDTAYMIENPHAKDALPNYPYDLVKYTRTVKTDENGFFKFTGLPDGEYVAWAYLEHAEDEHPTRERSQLAMGANGSMVSIPTFRKGLKIRSDDVVVETAATVNSAGGFPGGEITGFTLLGDINVARQSFRHHLDTII